MRRSATLLSLLLPLTTAAAATDYLIDSVHSQAAFGVRLFWFDHVSGQFTQIAGSLHPGLQLGTYVVDARIAANSVVMISHHMRDWVLAPAFFDAQHYPTIHFVSDPLPQNELAQGGMLSGSLTLRGITAPMRFTLHPTNCTPGGGVLSDQPGRQLATKCFRHDCRSRHLVRSGRFAPDHHLAT